MDFASNVLLKVKKEVTSEDEFELSNLTKFEGDNKSLKQEYHCKEEINLEWDENDNDYADRESESNNISHGTTVKSETDDGNLQVLRGSAVKTHSSSKTTNALAKLIKRCCSKCDNLTEITTSFLYRKTKCATCLTVSLLFQCAKCNKRYTHYDSARYHISSKCDPEEYHKCTSCSYKTTIRSQLTKHVKRVHKKNNNRSMVKCTICGREFKYAYSLNRHSKKSCGLKLPKNFVKCDNCDRKFKDDGYLEKHMKVCGQEVNLRCDHCEFKSKHKQRLITHLRKRHSAMR